MAFSIGSLVYKGIEGPLKRMVVEGSWPWSLDHWGAKMWGVGKRVRATERNLLAGLALVWAQEAVSCNSRRARQCHGYLQP